VDVLTRIATLSMAVWASGLGAGCIGVSPEQAEADALGPDTGRFEEGPLHRAGFPCTRCHGDAWWQEDPVYELAGTIYRRRTDREGIENAQVLIADAAGHQINARTNRAGNFFLVREGSEPRQAEDGRFEIPFALSFPLRVSVVADGLLQEMRNPIWRERSCATCHRGEPNETNNGPIFTLETSP
jgi:hypothetical protein